MERNTPTRSGFSRNLGIIARGARILRIVALLICVATPSVAWEYTPGNPCRLLYQTSELSVELTYDPAAPLYSITVTVPDRWPDAPTFSMRFDGPQARTIGTDRHRLSEDGRSLTVTDRGFGNVLDGLQFNETATASSGDLEVSVPLSGAEAEVEKFRSCEQQILSS